MKTQEKFWKTVLGIFMAILFLIAAPTSGSAFSSSFTIIQPGDARAQTGKTYGEWSAKWWQYALEIPMDDSPFFDTTGANCNFGQAGSVFFLVSTNGGTETRNECVVPAGEILFFPLLSIATLAQTPQEPELAYRATIQGFVKSTKVLRANIDGEDVSIGLDPDATTLRTLSPAGFFTITAPENNVFGGTPGQPYNTVSDGFYLMVAPLPPGPHTITFGGTSRNSAAYMTYNLYVEP